MGTGFSFSVGAHLLLWVFPLVLTLTALALHFLLGQRGGRR
jgi:hypothetical protein